MKISRGNKIVYTLQGSNVIHVSDLDKVLTSPSGTICRVLGTVQCDFSTVLSNDTVIRVMEENEEDEFYQLWDSTGLWYPFGSAHGYCLSEIVNDRCEVEVVYSPDL